MSENAPARLIPAKEAYRLWASEYDTTPNPLLSLEHRSLLPLHRQAAGCDVVDLGCGTGRWLKDFEALGAKTITGIDLSKEMLDCASKKLDPATQLIQASCMKTGLTSASSDWIVASFLLSYLEDLTAFARETARISRPDAMVIISDLHPATREYGWKRNFFHKDEVIEIQTHPYQISTLQTTMKQAGFQLIFLHELCFDEEEKIIFIHAGRPDLFTRVEGLPVLMIAGYQRGSE